MLRLRSVLGLMLLSTIALGACSSNDLPTAPTQVQTNPAISVTTVKTSLVSSDNTSGWQHWSIQWTSACTGRTYVGDYWIHLEQHTRVDAVGNTYYAEHLNVRDGRLTDQYKNVYVFQNVGTDHQFNTPTGDFQVNEFLGWNIISLGKAPNEFTTLHLTITGNAFGITGTTNVFATDCRGA